MIRHGHIRWQDGVGKEVGSLFYEEKWITNEVIDSKPTVKPFSSCECFRRVFFFSQGVVGVVVLFIVILLCFFSRGVGGVRFIPTKMTPFNILSSFSFFFNFNEPLTRCRLREKGGHIIWNPSKEEQRSESDLCCVFLLHTDRAFPFLPMFCFCFDYFRFRNEPNWNGDGQQDKLQPKKVYHPVRVISYLHNNFRVVIVHIFGIWFLSPLIFLSLVMRKPKCWDILSPFFFAVLYFFVLSPVSIRFLALIEAEN